MYTYYFGIFTKDGNGIFSKVTYKNMGVAHFDFVIHFSRFKIKLEMSSQNSERSEECIDFTMIITSRNNAPISNYGGGFRCKSEYPWCIIKFSKKLRKTKKKKMTEKREFLRKTSFRPNRIFFMVVIQKLITENTCNFHQMLMSVVSIYNH
ncbi:Uncharacterized protein FWK35_00006692 [Aphis craccivora]|uniref:Uncharacterized protein n=1 Tax=Aphis craccivora TaxID=307492 RepID=A0A6G0ZBG2_APHCR|nr:Uncharacterized protein FWK35_00006692 [Aphis craccivora]